MKETKVVGCCKKYNCELKLKQASDSCFKNNKYNFCKHFEPNLLHSHWIGERYKIPTENDLIIFDDIINIFCDASFYEPNITMLGIIIMYKNEIIDKKHIATKAKSVVKAEKKSIEEALVYVKENNIKQKVNIFSDCLNAVASKTEYYSKNLLDFDSNICFRWIPRKLNTVADKFCQCIVS